MDQIGRLNAMQATGNTQAAANVKPTETVDIPIGKGGNYKLSGKTLEALVNPQPGDFMYNLNKMSGLIDFSA